MEWKQIDGYAFPYRVNKAGSVQRQLSSGQWRDMAVYLSGGRAKVNLKTVEGKWKDVALAPLVAEAWMGGVPPGMVAFHENGSKLDCSVHNIIFLSLVEIGKRTRPGNSRPVIKVDRSGEIVDCYPSTMAAARANHISQAAISKRCLGRIQDPYRLDGFDYRYENPGPGIKYK